MKHIFGIFLALFVVSGAYATSATVKEVVDSFDEEQQKVFYAMFGLALEKGKKPKNQWKNLIKKYQC